MVSVDRLIQSMLAAKANEIFGVMLDLDGASMLKTPAIHDGVEPETKLDTALSLLLDQGHHVAINTGRPEIFVRNVFPQTYARLGFEDNFWVSTENGASVKGKDVNCVRALPHVEKLRDHFARAIQVWPGALIEIGKEHSMTISVAKAEEKEAAFHALVDEAQKMAKQQGGFEIISGLTPRDGYIEFVNPNVSKGSSTRIICESDVAIKWTAFGDSKADVAMWREVQAHGGEAVGVGETSPDGADYYIHDHHVTQHVVRQVSLG